MQILIEHGFRYRTPDMMRKNAIVVTFYQNGNMIVFDSKAGLIERGDISELRIEDGYIELGGKRFDI